MITLNQEGLGERMLSSVDSFNEVLLRLYILANVEMSNLSQCLSGTKNVASRYLKHPHHIPLMSSPS